MNEIDKSLRKFVISHAPVSVVKCGEIVTTKWGGWKHPHKVKIYEVGVEIVSLNLTIGERGKLGITGFVGVEYYYYGNRLNNKGEPTGVKGAVLTNFVTDNGVKWERIGQTFNHYGLTFTIERIADG